VPAFIVYVTVVIAVSLVVYVFFLKNRAETALDREQGNAYQLVASGARRGAGGQDASR
jgi:MHS family alpha-ketoglutarate permease-like MFS transporter